MILYSSWLTNGCVAQLARAFGSYPTGRWFESVRSHQHRSLWPHGQVAKTPPFHGGIMGSNPVGVTKQVKGEPVSIRRRIRLYHILQKDLLTKNGVREFTSHAVFVLLPPFFKYGDFVAYVLATSFCSSKELFISNFLLLSCNFCLSACHILNAFMFSSFS